VGVIVGIVVARRHATAAGIDGDRIVDIGLIGLVAGIIGARALSVLADGMLMDFVHLCTDPRQVEALDRLVDHCTADSQCGYDYRCATEGNFCYPPRDCLAALKFWYGGLTYYGGLLLAVPLGIWYARKHELDVRVVADVTAPVIMLGLFFGRLGCFFNGCCYGAPTSSWMGIDLPGHAESVHPTQLYEAIATLALYLALHYIVRPRKRADGEVFAWMLVLYAVTRSLLELFRADPRGSLGPVSTSQLISVPLAAFGLWAIARLRKSAAEREPRVI
jgi:phosphatidylglycerol:prolipoprotein diacylglycerol transferase